MQASYALSQSVVPADSPSAVDLLITLRADAPAAARERRPLDLSLVIDRSGSMAGPPLRHALQAAAALVEQLTPRDVLSVVVYDDHVDTILPPQFVTDKAAIRAALGRVTPGGTTNLSGGWLKGCEHVQIRASEDMIHRVLLLTDGRANVGVTDPTVLIKTARQKAEAGIVTTTLGFGANFQEDLLIGMAKAAGGNFYFIQSPDDAAEVFQIELDSLKSVAAQNLTVTLRPVPGVGVASLLSGYRAETTDGRVTISMGDVYENEDKRLAVALTVPAQSALGPQELMQVSYHCDSVAGGIIEAQAGDLGVAASVGTVDQAMAAAPGTDVILQISRIRIAGAKDAAVELADKGDLAAAAQTLRATIQDLRDKGLHETFEVAEELDQLEHYAERLESRRFDAGSRKEMRDQSYQASARNRADLSLRGVGAGSAQDLETVTPADADSQAAAGQGVQVVCNRQGGKLRVHAQSPGYDPGLNVQFPRGIREAGVTYLVDELRPSPDGSFYHAVGKVRRVVLPGQENRYASASAPAPRGTGKASAVTGSAASLETTSAVGDGVLVQCIKDGSKLRARVVSDGFDPNYNIRFPRDIREENTLYVVDEVIEAGSGGSYIACGKIRRLVP